MALYICGSQGPEIGKIQQKLKDLKFYNGPIDNDFAGGTESAVKAFQRDQGLESGGQANEATWVKLFDGMPVQEPAIKAAPLNERCLALTGSFETEMPPPDCFAGLSGDFDGQGISLGVCQWNLGQGSLQPLLQQIVEDHPQLIDTVFHIYAAEFRHVLGASHDEQMAWARSIQDSQHRIIEPWRGLLKSLARLAEFDAIQVASAAGLFRGAEQFCKTFKVTSERAMALMFDIKVQNYSINQIVMSQIERDFAALPTAASRDATEVARLQIIANRRAQAANPRWVADVRTRKLTIANGKGVVHGRHYDLEEQYGIGLAPFTPTI